MGKVKRIKNVLSEFNIINYVFLIKLQNTL